MGLFSKKHQDEPVQQSFADDASMRSDPQHSSNLHSNPTLPPSDHTLQSANIDGILPATTEQSNTTPVSSYTGFDEPNTSSAPSDDQNDYIMDPVPISSQPPQSHDDTVDEPALQHSTPTTQPDDFQEPESEQSEQEPPVSIEEPETELSQEPDEITEQTLNNVSSDPAPRHTTNEDLAKLKEEALRQLTPLARHLDQTPEEKFHTTMMMLQATDDQNLVKQAFEAANAITDEKARAQALLDVVNEINYFTQNK